MARLDERYRLVERLGRGGMSVVWRAFDDVLGRQVAVKVLAGDYAANPDLRHGIRREARAAARLPIPTSEWSMTTESRTTVAEWSRPTS